MEALSSLSSSTIRQTSSESDSRPLEYAEAASGLLARKLPLFHRRIRHRVHQLMHAMQNEEAGDPRNRLPLSQLVSPLKRGGPSEGTEYIAGP